MALGFPFSRPLQAIIVLTCENKRPKDKAAALAFEALLYHKAQPGDKPRPGTGGETVKGKDSLLPLDIRRLTPFNRPTVPTSKLRRRSSSGFIPIAKRLAAAAFAPNPGRLFRRRIRQQGGTVLIDASGSMDLEDSELRKLCEAAPAATVAYYCGRKSKGYIRLYAAAGRRHDGSNLERPTGGNFVDLEVLTWLLTQRGPLVLVTDGQFCGGIDGNADKALLLLKDLTQRGIVTWCKDVKQTLALFSR
jgi:hypothetical protein